MSVAVVPEKPPGGAIEIELDGGMRLRVDAALMRKREAGAAGAGAMIGLPAEYGHAAGLRRAGAAGAGDAEARPALRAPVRVPGQARRADQGAVARRPGAVRAGQAPGARPARCGRAPTAEAVGITPAAAARLSAGGHRLAIAAAVMAA